MSATFFVLRAPLLALETLETLWDASDRERLQALATDPQIAAALALASPDLAAGLERWAADPESRAGRSAERALLRYLTRMCTRTALFGTFAAYAVGEFADGPARMELGSREELRVRERPDPGCLADAVATAAATDDGALLVRRDPGLYEAAGRLRVAPRGRRIVALRPTPEVRAVIEAARQPAPAAALGDPAVVGRLLARGALQPAGLLPTTGAGAEAQARAALEAIPGAGVYAAPTQRQADAVRPAALQLPHGLARDVERAAELLARVAPAHAPPTLTAFRVDFERRYGTRPVGLLEALDPDCGVRLRDDAAPSATPLAPLLELIERGRATGEVELGEPDLVALSGRGPRLPLPDAFAVVVRLEAGTTAGPLHLVDPEVSGPSGARLLGRLCDGDPDLERRVREHVRAEEGCRPGDVFAELTYAPDTDWGLAVSYRPVLRDWEVACASPSGAPPAQVLEISDLDLSLAAGELVVRSRSLDCRVHVRMSTSVNHRWLSFPAARLLRLLESQGCAGHLRWSWGDAQDAPVLPRVRCGRVVLARRRWTLPLGPDDALERWRAARGIPARVGLLGGDGEQAVDLRTAFGADALRSAARADGRVRLCELNAGSPSPVHGPDGRYAHDLIVPVIRHRVHAPTPPRPPRVPLDRRRFPPGGSWLYAKLYGPPSAADDVLAALGATLAGEPWFFIRYADPDPHLRVRVPGEPAHLWGTVLPALHAGLAPALDDGRLHRLTLDTYEREIERFGGLAGVELMERAAHADSVAALALLAAGGVPRHLMAVASVEALLRDAGLHTEEREALCAAAARQLAPSGAPQLAAAERAGRPAVARVLAELPAWPALQARSAALGPLPADAPLTILAHLQINRLLPRSGDHGELRVWDALARAHRAARLRAGR